MERTYSVGSFYTSLLYNLLTSLQDAVAALNTVQSNYAIVNAIRTSGRSLNKQAIPEMIEWCRKIGYEVCACPWLREVKPTLSTDILFSHLISTA